MANKVGHYPDSVECGKSSDSRLTNNNNLATQDLSWAVFAREALLHHQKTPRCLGSGIV